MSSDRSALDTFSSPAVALDGPDELEQGLAADEDACKVLRGTFLGDQLEDVLAEGGDVHGVLDHVAEVLGAVFHAARVAVLAWGGKEAQGVHRGVVYHEATFGGHDALGQRDVGHREIGGVRADGIVGGLLLGVERVFEVLCLGIGLVVTGAIIGSCVVGRHLLARRLDGAAARVGGLAGEGRRRYRAECHRRGDGAGDDPGVQEACAAHD